MKPRTALTSMFVLAASLFSACIAAAQQPAGLPIRDASGCVIFYDRLPDQHRTFKWSGACRNGYGNGPGTLEYYSANGTLIRTITGTENMGLLVGPYSKVQFDPPSNAKMFERGTLDNQSNQDGPGEIRYEDPFRVLTNQREYSHGQVVGPHPLLVHVYLTPAGVDKYGSYDQIVTYNTFTQGPDGILRGEGMIVNHRVVKGIDTVTATWVGPIVDGVAGGAGVWTFTECANMPYMNGMRQQITAVSNDGNPISAVLYGPNGAVFARTVNGVSTTDQAAVSAYVSSYASNDNNDGASSTAFMTLFGFALDAYASKSHNNANGLPSAGKAVAQSMSSALKWTAVNQTAAEQKSIEDAQQEARTNVSQDTAKRCEVTCTTVYGAQSKRCVMNFGGPGQSIGPCSDMIQDQYKQCKEICDDPIRLKTSN